MHYINAAHGEYRRHEMSDFTHFTDENNNNCRYLGYATGSTMIWDILTIDAEGEISAGAGNGKHAEQHGYDGNAKELVHLGDGGENMATMAKKGWYNKIIIIIVTVTNRVNKLV